MRRVAGGLKATFTSRYVSAAVLIASASYTAGADSCAMVAQLCAHRHAAHTASAAAAAAAGSRGWCLTHVIMQASSSLCCSFSCSTPSRRARCLAARPKCARWACMHKLANCYHAAPASVSSCHAAVGTAAELLTCRKVYDNLKIVSAHNPVSGNRGGSYLTFWSIDGGLLFVHECIDPATSS